MSRIRDNAELSGWFLGPGTPGRGLAEQQHRRAPQDISPSRVITIFLSIYGSNGVLLILLILPAIRGYYQSISGPHQRLRFISLPLQHPVKVITSAFLGNTFPASFRRITAVLDASASPGYVDMMYRTREGIDGGFAAAVWNRNAPIPRNSQISAPITRNATSNDTYVEALAADLGFSGGKRRLRCVGHILNLAVRTMFAGEDPRFSAIITTSPTFILTATR